MNDKEMTAMVTAELAVRKRKQKAKAVKHDSKVANASSQLEH